MLHLIHLLERRFGAQRTPHIAMRLLLASALLLMLGLGLLLSGRVAAQETAMVDGPGIATRLLDHLDAGRYADAEAMFVRVEPILRRLPIGQNARVVIGANTQGRPSREVRIPRL